MFDPDLITAAVVVGETAMAAAFAIAWRRSVRRPAAHRRALGRADGHVANLQRALGDAFRDADRFRAIADELGVEIVAHQKRDREIAARAAARAARKKAKRAALKADDATARRKHTVQALSNLRLRPRAEVVAEVRARRSA